MHQYWEKLKSEPTPEINKVNHKTFESYLWTLLATKDSDNKLGLRIQFEELSKEILKDKNFPEWDVNDSLFEKQFNYLAEDILSDADKCKTEISLLESIYGKCCQWQDFLKKKRNEKLDKPKQMGLIGELTFLKKLFSIIDLRSAIDAWKGPDKYAKDFLISSNGFEIKSKNSGLNAKVKISSEYQLLKDDLNKLFLVVYVIDNSSKSNQRAFILNDLISEIREFIKKNDPDCLAIFNSKINDYGFSDDHNYSKDYWISQDTFYIFGVEEEFPKITVEDIDRKFLSRVNYELSLTDLEGFSIDNIDEFLRI
jgi:hypothetical protein